MLNLFQLQIDPTDSKTWPSNRPGKWVDLTIRRNWPGVEAEEAELDLRQGGRSLDLTQAEEEAPEATTVTA